MGRGTRLQLTLSGTAVAVDLQRAWAERVATQALLPGLWRDVAWVRDAQWVAKRTVM